MPLEEGPHKSTRDCPALVSCDSCHVWTSHPATESGADAEEEDADAMYELRWMVSEPVYGDNAATRIAHPSMVVPSVAGDAAGVSCGSCRASSGPRVTCCASSQPR